MLVECNVETKILRAQLLTNAPGGRRADKTDTENTNDSSQRKGTRTSRHRMGVDDFHHSESDDDAEHTAKATIRQSRYSLK
jgi:hypothetical protein